MLAVSFYLLTAAVAAGTILGLLHLRATDSGARPPLIAGIAHGIAGATGLILLIPVLLGPARGTAAGAAAFGPIAGWLLGGALVTGALIFLSRRRDPAVTMAIHVGIAITGYIMLVAWYAVG